MHDFEKIPKNSFDTENSDFNQLDFPFNKMMFMVAQYQIVYKYEDIEEYKWLKIWFHVFLGKREEEIWSLVKIVWVLNISKDILFKGVLQNYLFCVVRANNIAFDFSVANFPLINLHDLICVSRILKEVDISKLQLKRKEDFLIGFAHIKLFIDNYYEYLALTNVELALAIGKHITVPQPMLKSQASLKSYEDGEICLKPLGIMFVGKN